MIYIPILYSIFTPIYYSSIIESPEIILHPNKSSKARKKGADDVPLLRGRTLQGRTLHITFVFSNIS